MNNLEYAAKRQTIINEFTELAIIRNQRTAPNIEMARLGWMVRFIHSITLNNDGTITAFCSEKDQKSAAARYAFNLVYVFVREYNQQITGLRNDL